jgi:intein/homing endonuclease
MKRPYKDKLICIETEDGKILKMTPEHPIYTKRGWIQAKDLKETEEVYTW